MKVGRPTIYSEDILQKSRSYLATCIDEIEEFHKTRGEKSDSYDRLVKVKLPTIEGLATYLDIHRDTLYSWEREHAEFSDILEQLRQEQSKRLIENSLSGNYNHVIAKLLLSSKHGYVERQDITSDGKGLQITFDKTFEE